MLTSWNAIFTLLHAVSLVVGLHPSCQEEGRSHTDMPARRAANPAAIIAPEGGRGQAGHKWDRSLGLARAAWMGVKVPTLCTQKAVSPQL